MMIVVVSSHRIAMHIQGVQKIEIIFIINTRISRRVTIVTWCHNCDVVCHNCDILFVKMLELGSEIIPKN